MACSAPSGNSRFRSAPPAFSRVEVDRSSVQIISGGTPMPAIARRMMDAKGSMPRCPIPPEAITGKGRQLR